MIHVLAAVSLVLGCFSGHKDRLLQEDDSQVGRLKKELKLRDVVAKSDCCTLYLVNQGSTDWSDAECLQGWTDVPLNETGRQEARQAGEFLVQYKIDVIYSSSLEQARETAGLIQDKLGKCSLFVDDRLRGECHGAFDGFTKEQYQQEPHFQIYNALPAEQELFFPCGEGGESKADMARRLIPALRDICKAHLGEHVAVVTHGGLFKLLNFYQGIYSDQGTMSIPHGSIMVIHGNGELLSFEVDSKQLLPIEMVEDLDTLPGTTDEMIRIYFIRNGETEFSAIDANGMKKTTGRSVAVPLNEQGMQQAQRLHEMLSSKIQDVVMVYPPAVRAEQTALQLLSDTDRIALGGTYEALFEVAMGSWEGKLKDQLYQDEYRLWQQLSAREKYATPKVVGGESYAEAASRALLALDAIIQQEPSRTIFVILSENLINALAMHWSGIELSLEPGSSLPILPMDNCDLLLCEVPRGESIEQTRVKGLLQSL